MRNFLPSGGRPLPQNNDTMELLKAWAATSLAFAIVMVHGQVIQSEFPFFLIVAAITCGVGFVLHELAHRTLARMYDAEAHFAADNAWLLISIAISFTGFFIAAPGAVWHSGSLTKRQSGIVAVAGPVTNLVLALIFALLFYSMRFLPFSSYYLNLALFIGFSINGWLGLFNMIPVGPLDGAKVLSWSPVVFGVTALAAVFIVFGLDKFL